MKIYIFHRIRTNNPQIYIKPQKPPNCQNNLEEQKDGCSDPWLQIIRKDTLIIPAWYWHRYRYIDQQPIIESPEINRYTYGQLIYDKGARIYNGEKTMSSISAAGETGQLHVKQRN